MTLILKKGRRVIAATPDYWKSEKAKAKKKRVARTKGRKALAKHAKKTFRKAWRKLI